MTSYRRELLPLSVKLLYPENMSIVDFPPWILTCLLAPFGLVFGSFANVLIHRLPREEAKERNVVTKPSHCPACGRNIRWFHNIPLISWLWLLGKCANCGWKIPIRYPVVELLAGILFGISPWFFPFGTLIWCKGTICGYALIVLFFTDLTEYILPDVVQFPLMAMGLLFALPQYLWPEAVTTISLMGGWETASVFYNGLQIAPAWGQWHVAVTLSNSIIGMALGYGLPWAFNFAYIKVRNAVVTRVLAKEPLESGMGMGDFKMLAWLGAFWGWGHMLGILLAAVMIMCIFVLPTHFLHKRESDTMYPLGCGLALATPIVIFWGPWIWQAFQVATWY
ncbi:MAG: prepilin peptidase [Holophagaceae bacterium]|nr:prepilin peptidase [Holophagaceae bacterium]